MIDSLIRLEGTWFGAIARESLYGFQVLVAVHILGIVFSVGPLLWIDLRMLGLSLTDFDLIDIYRALAKWLAAGFAVMLLSGMLLFTGFASSAIANPFFLTKLALMTLAGINALVFHRLLRRLPRGHVGAVPMPGFVRFAALASLALWAAVIVCGRLISYTLF